MQESHLMKKIVFILVLFCCFACKEESKNNTRNLENLNQVEVDTVSFLTNAEKLERSKLKKLDERYYHIAIHTHEEKKDTIVNMDFLESDETLNYTFDYEPLRKTVHEDSINLVKENVEVVIVKSKFDAIESTITYDADSLNVIKIDNHTIYGADAIPKTYISKMYLNLSGNYFEIDKMYYEDLYEPNFNSTEAYYYDKEIIITMGNSDGYLGYSVTFFLDNKMNMKRIVYLP